MLTLIFLYCCKHIFNNFQKIFVLKIAKNKYCLEVNYKNMSASDFT